MEFDDKHRQLKNLIDHADLTGFKVEEVLEGGEILHAPCSGHPRPYAVLDYLWLNEQIPPVWGLNFTYENGQFFSDQQRNLILAVNRIRNNGWIKSDEAGDDFTTLMVEGSDQAPEVDHIVQRSTSGSNAFSNARVVSSRYNKKGLGISLLSGRQVESSINRRREPTSYTRSGNTNRWRW